MTISEIYDSLKTYIDTKLHNLSLAYEQLFIDYKTKEVGSSINNVNIVGTNIDNVKTTAMAVTNKVSTTIDTIDALRALTITPSSVWVSGYYTKGDGAFGSHIFEWDDTSTETDNGGTIIKLNSVAIGRYKLKYDGTVNVKWFGAKFTGTDEVTNYNTLQNALTNYDHVVIPKENNILLVNNDTPITLKSGQTIDGGGTIKRTNDDKPLFEALGTSSSHITDIKITNLIFSADSSVSDSDTGDTVEGVVRLGYVSNFTFSKNICKNIGFGVFCSSLSATDSNYINQMETDYANTSIDTISSGINISDNVFDDNSAYDRNMFQGNAHCIVLGYCRDYEVSNNIILGYKAGVYSFGGGLHNEVDFTDTTLLKNINGNIRGNILDTTNVGIWCWGSQGLLVEGNIINNCNHESFDSEASSNITFNGNKVIGATGQCFNMFYDNNNIVISNNHCTIDEQGDFFINSAQSTDYALSTFSNIEIINNTVESISTNATKNVASMQATGMDTLIIKNNIFKNTIFFLYGGIASCEINNNEFILNKTPVMSGWNASIIDSTNIARNTDANYINIKNNSFKDIASSYGIFVRSASIDYILNIDSNTFNNVKGLFNMSVSNVANQVLSSGKLTINTLNNKAKISNPQFALIQDSNDTLTDANLVHIWRNNTDLFGEDLYINGNWGNNPGVDYYDLYYSIGSEVRSTPTAGGTFGYVCITSGHTTGSVWKTFGTIAS